MERKRNARLGRGGKGDEDDDMLEGVDEGSEQAGGNSRTHLVVNLFRGSR